MMAWLGNILLVLAAFTSVLLIGIVLLQRGRGGGLAGALGGMGGQSAFGTKAGDVFTRITIVLAIIWVVLAAGGTFVLQRSTSKLEGTDTVPVTAAPGTALPGSGLPGGGMPTEGLPGMTLPPSPGGTAGGAAATGESNDKPAAPDAQPGDGTKPESTTPAASTGEAEPKVEAGTPEATKPADPVPEGEAKPEAATEAPSATGEQPTEKSNP
jgi:preprotein translocase subunit SecG